MDWNAAIEQNREALKRVLAALVAMAGLPFSPPAGRRWPAGPDEGHSYRLTLPRHLHRAVLRLLRPAEAAARRLVIVAARGLVVTLPPTRPRKPKPDPKPAHAALRSLGIAVVMSPADIARAAAASRTACRRAAARAGQPLLLPLLDPLPRPFRVRRRTVAPHAAPRIRSFDGARPHRLPQPPSPNDPVDATRLALRLAALASALDDLPKHARRFARWKARSDAGRIRRLAPLRLGRPPGSNRKPVHEVHEVLSEVHGLALWAQERPDTS